ncbi:MAG: hypothetical protein KatS3mg119_1388 [Rhodothalassiaceae bacterium]|nr:MAG: hypothetical protein KatS3mg119_1388 [Rhodothalassiaceae bacterium]
MYLCVCQAIREADIDEAAAAGLRPRRARELFLALGKRPQCGVCLRHVQDRLNRMGHGEAAAGRAQPTAAEFPATPACVPDAAREEAA